MQMLWKRSGKGLKGEMAFHCRIYAVRNWPPLYRVSEGSTFCDIGRLRLSDITRSERWVAALSQCCYLTGQNLVKKKRVIL